MKEMPAAYQWKYDKADLKYCPRCGAPFTLEDVDIPGQPQLVCHACKFVFYLDPKLVVVAIVTFGSRILLLKRAKEPGKGKWALLAGFVERGEDPYAALKREAQEETGLEIKIEKVFKVNAFPDAGMVQLIFEATALKRQIVTNAESYEGRFFPGKRCHGRRWLLHRPGKRCMNLSWKSEMERVHEGRNDCMVS